MESSAPYRTLRQGEMLNWYRIERILGRGGFGVIYFARDTNLDHDVAIKEYAPGAIARRDGDSRVLPLTEELGDEYQRGLERFILEARNLVRFRHPNIVRVMSVFQENNTAYMVMEFEKGKDLREHFASVPGARSENSLKALLRPIAQGLAEVHRHGFIHRDIKPSNILVREDGSPVLLDFGSARNAGRLDATQNLTALVSAGYAPLEQYDGDGVDGQQGPWTDIYALGGVLYHAVSGSDPVDSTRRASAVFNGGRDPLLPATLVGKGEYDDAFLRAIDWALAFRIADRPQTLADWLPALLSGTRPAGAGPPGPFGAAAADASTVVSGRRAAEAATARRAARDDPASTRAPRADDRVADGDGRPAYAATAFLGERRTRRAAGLAGGAIGAAAIAGAAWLLLAGGGADGVLGERGADVAATGEADETAVSAAASGTSSGAREPEGAGRASDVDGETATDAARVTAAARQAEAEREARALAAEAARQAEEARLAEAERLAEEQRAREARDAERARIAEATRLADEREAREAEAARAAEAARLAEARRAREAEAARVAEERRVREAEAARVAETARRAEAREAERAARAAEAARLAEERRAKEAEAARRVAAEGSRSSTSTEDTRLARNGTEAGNVAADARAPRPISDEDIGGVMQSFEALRRAIVRQDADAMDALTEPSAQNRLFRQLIEDFAELDVQLGDIRVTNADQAISATLAIRAMMRENGDRALPSDAYAEREIVSVRRGGEWSPIRW